MIYPAPLSMFVTVRRRVLAAVKGFHLDARGPVVVAVEIMRTLVVSSVNFYSAWVEPMMGWQSE